MYIKIIFSNACRSVVPANMTLQEFHAAKKNPRGYIINVHEHKTDYAYGPANVFLSCEDFDILKTFVEFARPQVIPKELNVFLSYRGNSQTGEDIS